MIKKILLVIGIVFGSIIIIIATAAVVSVTAQNIPPSTKSPTFDRGFGSTAQCNDGEYSYSVSHAGTCAGHGGVKLWY